MAMELYFDMMTKQYSFKSLKMYAIFFNHNIYIRTITYFGISCIAAGTHHCNCASKPGTRVIARFENLEIYWK